MSKRIDWSARPAPPVGSRSRGAYERSSVYRARQQAARKAAETRARKAADAERRRAAAAAARRRSRQVAKVKADAKRQHAAQLAKARKERAALAAMQKAQRKAALAYRRETKRKLAPLLAAMVKEARRGQGVAQGLASKATHVTWYAAKIEAAERGGADGYTAVLEALEADYGTDELGWDIVY